VVFGVLDESGTPMGIAMLRSVDRVHRSADLHITIGDRSRWGKGYGAESIRLMCDHAFDDLKLHKVISTPFAFNQRMVRCLQKCGFQREGRLRDALWIGERYVDVEIMGRINPADCGDTAHQTI
jgi:RimJ/RimL family protein N-acetyltransferase